MGEQSYHVPLTDDNSVLCVSTPLFGAHKEDVQRRIKLLTIINTPKYGGSMVLERIMEARKNEIEKIG